MVRLRNVALSVVGAVLCGCGGGGGGDSASTAPSTPVAAPSAAVLATSDNSYRNFKMVGLTPQSIPLVFGAHAWLDVNGDGRLDLFEAELTYLPATTPQAATPSQFAFWMRQLDGSFVKDTTRFASTAGCIHPRKALVADFNRDGRPDVFVACHGFDFPPYPGERNKVVLSQPNGTYVIRDASPDVGFFHSASAADLNGDGFPDVIVTSTSDPARAFVLLNNGDGSFTRETNRRLPTLSGNYFTVELADVDGDGTLDLLLAGHEFEGAASRIYINPGTNLFVSAIPITVPAVPGDGVVLDFTITGPVGDRVLWVLRTSGGDGTFYQGRVLQKVQLATLQSSLVVNQRASSWIPWILPAVIGVPVITTDDARDGLTVPQ
jgi:hypothetical protein